VIRSNYRRKIPSRGILAQVDKRIHSDGELSKNKKSLSILKPVVPSVEPNVLFVGANALKNRKQRLKKYN
jgi:hypothetical protein